HIRAERGTLIDNLAQINDAVSRRVAVDERIAGLMASNRQLLDEMAALRIEIAAHNAGLASAAHDWLDGAVAGLAEIFASQNLENRALINRFAGRMEALRRNTQSAEFVDGLHPDLQARMVRIQTA